MSVKFSSDEDEGEGKSFGFNISIGEVEFEQTSNMSESSHSSQTSSSEEESRALTSEKPPKVEEPVEKPAVTGAESQNQTKRARLLCLVERLLERVLDLLVRRGKLVDVTLVELTNLCTEVGMIFLDCDACIQVWLDPGSSVVVVGDIHGHFTDLIRIFDHFGHPPKQEYIFLGNYVSHGCQSLEVLLLLFCYKIKYPKSLHLLRGNHENQYTTRLYGFYEEMDKRLNAKAWKLMISVFEMMPLAAVVNNTVFCCHGGISPELLLDRLTSVKHLLDHMSQMIVRPVDGLEEGLAPDLMWADPDYEVERWGINEAGCSFVFGTEVLDEFLEKYKFDLIVRSNRMVTGGYEFFHGMKLLHIFSASFFIREFRNSAAVLHLNRPKDQDDTLEADIIVFDTDCVRRRGRKEA